jgi:hypothetical protein
MATIVAMVPTAPATAGIGLRFQADQDNAQCSQTQGQAKQISIHQSTSYEINGYLHRIC